MPRVRAVPKHEMGEGGEANSKGRFRDGGDDPRRQKGTTPQNQAAKVRRVQGQKKEQEKKKGETMGVPVATWWREPERATDVKRR